MNYKKEKFNLKELLFELCSKIGISGDENNISQFIKESLSKYGNTTIEKDGSVICILGNKEGKKSILFDAHIDQIGLIVTFINKDGFLKISPCGGVDNRQLLGKKVIIHGEKDVTGIISCVSPHLLKSGSKDKIPNIDDLYVDIGMSKDDAEKVISVGDRISIYNKPKELLNGRIASASLDDRAGVAVLMKLAENISKIETDLKVIICFTTQEEVGSLGAKISSYKYFPDEAIAVDVSFARQHDVSGEKYVNLGDGPMIGIAPSLCDEISQLLIDISEKENIKYTIEVMGGRTSTNADKISETKTGVKCGLVSIPQRYMHSCTEVVSIEDLENIVKLLTCYVENGGLN